MSNNIDDLSNDPFSDASNTRPRNTSASPDDSLAEAKDVAGQYMDVAMDRAKDAAGDYMRTAPTRLGRRLFFGFLLSFTMTNNNGVNSERERILRRLERGEKVSPHEFFFGQKFSIFGLVRTIIFIVILAGGAYYVFTSGLWQQFQEMQALSESIQQTTTP